ncbi:MAG: di-trans,poly-cis-decaprenylcistransferase [Kiritimatiellae bacterium]|nr:di-trans,poly-cis-decaprenylcistransferase [Kiritimatiellia bacterium]
MPRHIAIIMDGNGRWAKKRMNIRLFGHRAGAEAVRRAMDCCRRHGVQYLTLYAFSTENWSRPKDEVDGLMNLLRKFLRDNERELIEKECRFRVMGRKADLPEDLQAQIAQVEDATKGFEQQLIVCLSYGGRAEIVDAARRLADEARSGTLDPAAIDEAAFAARMYLPDVPDPDLIIRTSGELRLSNFLLWECAYSELFVTDTLWPDFSEKDFLEAVASFAKRKRRFGGLDASATKPQISDSKSQISKSSDTEGAT